MFNFTFTWIKLFGVLAIIISVFFDEIKDAYWNVSSFWKCHVPKWISLSVLYLFILIVINLEWWLWLLLAAFCHCLWMYSAKYVAPMPTAGSVWIRLFKILLKGDKKMNHFKVLLIISVILLIASFYLLFYAENFYESFAPLFVIIVCSILIFGREILNEISKKYPKLRKFLTKLSFGASGFSLKDLRNGYLGTAIGLIIGYLIIIIIELIKII